VLLAARDDPDWGPVLAIGTGGVAVELFDDVAYLGLPVENDEIAGAVARLKLGTILAGFRRQTPRDLPAVIAAAQGVARLFESLPPGAREIEVNPLVVLDEGRGAFAVDVLVATAATQP
jgi:hypothetical protein